MSEPKQCGACPGCAEKCRHEQENPPSPDGEVEVLATLVLGGAFDSDELGDCDIEWDSGAVEALQQKLVTGFDDVHIELVDRAHVARLQAEVERLKSESFEPLYNEVIDDRDKALARNAELEGLLLELRQCNSNEVWPVWAKINAALAEGK